MNVKQEVSKMSTEGKKELAVFIYKHFSREKHNGYCITIAYHVIDILELYGDVFLVIGKKGKISHAFLIYANRLIDYFNIKKFDKITKYKIQNKGELSYAANLFVPKENPERNTKISNEIKEIVEKIIENYLRESCERIQETK